MGVEVHGLTYSMTNLRGFRAIIGNNVKHMTKHARAARLQAPKTKSLSHLLTKAVLAAATHEAHQAHYASVTCRS